jgi:uncharacterized membrane-anchored protein
MTALRWLIVVIAFAGLAGLLSSLRDPIHFQFGAWDIAMPFGLLFFLLFALVSFMVLLDRLFRQVGNYMRWRRLRQTQKARAVMLRGFSLLASHDLNGAQQAAIEVDRLWHGSARDPFRLVFDGRLAEAEGDLKQAAEKYEQLGRQKDARLYALRARLRLAQRTHDDALLQKLSAQALKLAPHDIGLYDVRVRSLVARNQWGKAHSVLQRLGRKDVMAQGAVTQRRVALYLQQSTRALARNETGKALDAAKKASKLSESPGTVMAEIDAYLAQNDTRKAHKRLQAAWKTQADETLLTYWHRLAPEQNVFKFYETMLKLNASSALTHAALVQAAVNEGRSMEARAHLEALHRLDGESLIYAQSRALVAEQIDRDMVEARTWKSRADALRTARAVLPSVSVMSVTPEIL